MSPQINCNIDERRLEVRNIIKEEKLRRGHCAECNRVTKIDELCVFNLIYKDDVVKNVASIQFMVLNPALFDEFGAEEFEKCDLLCLICERLFVDYHLYQ